MKRSTFFIRFTAIYGCIFIVAILIAALTIKVVMNPPADILSHEQYRADSLRVVNILDRMTPYNRYTERMDTMPNGGIRLIVKRDISQRREFNDSNYLHLQAAGAIGINPVMKDADIMMLDRDIEHVESCEDFYLDKLTHSLPYLVPEAHLLLHDIGRAFRDSLQARGGGDYRIKVTSILRTNSSVKRLRRFNRNAVGSSAHLYGTTFDISYSNFACDSDTLPRTTEDLRLLLSEILINMRDKNRCYVKHERKQACFHITTRPVND